MNDLVSVIIPVHNQGDHIGDIIREYEAGLNRIANPHEFVLVVNACEDDSLEVCNALAQQLPSVRVVQSDTGGWGLAVRLGLDEARGNLLCYTNSARTSASDLILLVLYSVANPGAVIKAHRHRRDSKTRKIGSFLFNLQCRTLFELLTWDINATPKVFSRDVYDRIQPRSDGDLIDLEFYIRCQQLNIVILEVPIYSRPRHGGKSTTTYGSAMRLYQGAFQMWRSMRKQGS